MWRAGEFMDGDRVAACVWLRLRPASRLSARLLDPSPVGRRTVGTLAVLRCTGTFFFLFFFFFSSIRRHTISLCDWSSDVCSSDLRDSSNNIQVYVNNSVDPSYTPRNGGTGANSMANPFVPNFIGQNLSQYTTGKIDADRKSVV